MKKYKHLASLLVSLLLAAAVCTPGHCTHVHTEECGEDGVNCTHTCEECTEPDDKGWPKG